MKSVFNGERDAVIPRDIVSDFLVGKVEMVFKYAWDEYLQ